TPASLYCELFATEDCLKGDSDKQGCNNMLLEREGAAEAGWDSGSPATSALPPSPAAFTPTPSYTPSRYGTGRRVNPAALAVTAGVHVVFGLALLGLGVQAANKTRERMAVVELSTSQPPASQPPPQPQPEEQPRAVT